MKRVFISILIYLVFWGYISGQSSTKYDVEFSRICLIDSIAPDNKVQFWRFTQANNPGEYLVDVTYDLSSSYTPTGTLVKCCSCLSAASDTAAVFDPENDPLYATGGHWKHTIFGILILLGGVLIIRREKMATRIACTLFVLALYPFTQISAQSETRYDVEFSCICLVDSIGPGNVVQFYRFTQANNPGEYNVDVTYDLSSTYTPTGTVLGCSDYYLGDNPGGSGTAGTLAIWTGANSLGNSSVTESGQIISSSLTGALKVPSGTDAEVPVWAAGQLRYNTTQGGFQGGANGYYLPWANSPSFTSGSVLYSNGSRIVEDNTQFYWNGSELILNNGSTDLGSYTLQVNSKAIFGNNTSTNRLIVNEGQIDCYAPNGTKNTFSSNNPMELTNRGTTNATLDIIQSSGYGVDIGINSTSKPQLYFTYSLVTDYSTEYYPIQFLTGSQTPTDVSIGRRTYPNAGAGILWNYYVGSASFSRYDAAKLIPVVTDTTSNLVDVAMKLYLLDDNVPTLKFRLDPDIGLTLYDYGSGNITGTPAVQSISAESGGKLIERKFAYAEMYVTDTNPDTISFLAASTTPDQPTDLTAGELANFTYSAGRLTYTGAETAKFLVNTSVSFSFSEGSTDIEGWIYLDGAEVSKSEFHRKIGTGGDIGNSGQTCIVELATNSYIEIFFAPVAHTGDDDLIIENLNVNLVKI